MKYIKIDPKNRRRSRICRRSRTGITQSLISLAKTHSFALIMFAAITAIAAAGINDVVETSSQKELQMAQESIKRAAVSCYAVEGIYPESYEYIKENYGIIVNNSKYIVHYEIFASNIMPEITVIPVT